MQRAGVDFATRGELHDTAEIHHGDPRTEMLDHRQVVSDEKIRERQRNAEVCHQVQYLGLDRDVQRGHGLVGDDEIRVERQGASDGDSLRLSARDLVREAVRVIGVEADQDEKLLDPGLPFIARSDGVNVQRVTDGLADGDPRIE